MYIIITKSGLLWFLVTVTTWMLIAYGLLTPTWLIGPETYVYQSDNFTITKRPSLGLFTSCRKYSNAGFHCGYFNMEGLLTDSRIFPTEWKIGTFFIGCALAVFCVVVPFTLLSYCKQSLFGKSIHNVIGVAQAAGGVCVLIGLFLYPLAWGREKVLGLCGPEAESFYYAECKIGLAYYITFLSVVFSFLSAVLSYMAESSNLQSHIKRRIEQGETFICLP